MPADEMNELLRLEPLIRHGVRHYGTARQAPPTLPRQRRAPRIPRRHAETAQEVRDGHRPFALLQSAGGNHEDLLPHSED